MEAFAVAIQSVITDSGFLAFTTGNAIMILVGLILLYLAFAKGSYWRNADYPKYPKKVVFRK